MGISGTFFAVLKLMGHQYVCFLKITCMKSIIKALLLLFVVSSPAFGQEDYKVIKVNGTILLKSRGVSLETGTVFSPGEDLLFRSEDATAAVINSQKGRLIITSKNHDLTSTNTNYMPSMYNISSRGGAIINISDLRIQFSGRVAVLDRLGIVLIDDDYPMNKDNFFFLRYLLKGEEINKKMDFSGDTMFIDRKALFTVDGSPIPGADNTRIKLYYRKGKESVFISEFDLIFPDMNQLAKEVEVILNEVKNKPADIKIIEAGAYINDFYGKIDSDHLLSWLEKRFGIKK